ncbi:MAG: RnfABCDGE type electron transport complex subunit G [Zetaproteobacteria bacterium]|nr:RnfABCDGE type electron transport complex subunit G [Zetaproteobacteria bacterium]
MNIDREQWQMVMALFIVGLLTTFLLALTDIFTHEPIAQAKRTALHSALTEVLPPYTNQPLDETLTIATPTLKDEHHLLYSARDANGNIVGFAWETIANDGYAGSIYILMGVNSEGRMHAMRITDHKETPGLGDGITKNQPWIDHFNGQTLNTIVWGVKKDGGDFDQFTGATITPRAVIKTLHQELLWFSQSRQQIFKAASTLNKEENHE